MIVPFIGASPELIASKPFKVIRAPVALGLIGALTIGGKTYQPRLVAQCETLEDAQEVAYMENADEPAPDKNDFRKFFIIEFRGWDQPWHLHN